MTNPPDYNLDDAEGDNYHSCADARDLEVERIYTEMLDDPSLLVETLHNAVYGDDIIKRKYEHLIAMWMSGDDQSVDHIADLIASEVKNAISNNIK